MKSNLYSVKARLNTLSVSLCIVALLLSAETKAQFFNIPVSGFNQDVVADNAAGQNFAASSSTIGVDGANNVFMDGTFVDPVAGGSPCYSANIWPGSNTITSTNATNNTGITYTLQPAAGNNALQVTSSIFPGVLTFNTPVQTSILYLVATTGDGGSSPTFTVEVDFTDLSSQIITGVSAPDWCGGAATYKITPTEYYRIKRTDGICTGTGDLANLCPYIYELPVSLSSANYSKFISQIQIYSLTSGELNVFAVGGSTPCTPPNPPPSFSIALSATNTTTISGVINPASPVPSGYLVVRYPTGSAVTAPATGTTYIAGGTLGLGTIVQSSSSTSINATGLAASHGYDFYIYSYNTACAPAPVYSATALSAINIVTPATQCFQVNLTSSTYNCDAVANGLNSGSAANSTTATVDGTCDSLVCTPTADNFVFMDGTYSYSGSTPCEAVSVLPANNQLTSSNTTNNTFLTYTLQSYSANNDFQLTNSGTSNPLKPTSGQLTPITPFQASNIYFLGLGGDGAAAFTATIKYTDSTSQQITGISLPDWCGGAATYKMPNATSPQIYYRVNRSGVTTCSPATCQYFYEVPISSSASILPANWNKSVAYISIVQTTANVKVNIFALGAQPPCATPNASPSFSTPLAAASTSSITGVFNNASPIPSGGYLVVRYPTGSAVTLPATGTSYTAGTALGLGTVIQVGASTTVTATGLSANTGYDFYIYSLNTGSTCGGPIYSSSLLSATNVVTTACGGPSVPTTVQISPTNVANTYAGGFTTITGALASLATTGTNAPIILELQPNYLSEVSTTSITISSNVCFSATNGVTIRPAAAVSTPLVITSSSAVATVDFNGGNYVTIDGRPGGAGTSEMLQIINTSSTNAAISTIRFINEAHNNTVTYCNVQGQQTITTTVNPAPLGVIYFAGTNVSVAAGGLGNDNNTISFCDIHATSGGTPAIAVGAYIGSSQTSGLATDNDNNIITGCNIYDFYNTTSAQLTLGIKIDAGNNGWNITNNRMWESVSRAPATAVANWFRFIHLNPTTTTTLGSGFTITGNVFGGSNSSNGGTCVLNGGAFGTLFMDMNAGNGTGSVINNNTFQNIQYTSTLTTGIATGGAGTLSIISINTGNFTSISGNTINNIALVANGSGAAIQGIRLNGAPATTTTLVNNNTISNITASSATVGNASSIVGIISNGTGTVAIPQITNNQIFNLTNGNSATTATSGQVIGIDIFTTVATAPVITGNAVHDLTNYALNAGTGVSTPTLGIMINNTTVVSATISNNQIYNLTDAATSTSTSLALYIWGIISNCSTSATAITISGNLIHSFDEPNWAPSAITTAVPIAGGINVTSGFASIYNNMVRLGINGSGNSVTKPIQFIGINKNNSQQNNIWFNSVYIGGSNVLSSSALAYSVAFSRVTGNAADDYRDNIFVNTRTNASVSSSAKHYAVWLNSLSNISLNYNDYQYTSGTGNFFANVNNGVDVVQYTTGWVASDVNSLTLDPQFKNPTGTSSTVDLHIQPPPQPTPVEGTGVNIASVVFDYDGDLRASFTPTDIGADAGNFQVLPSCATPSAQATNLVLATISGTQINGTFTAASPAPDGYLVVRYLSGATATNPANGTTYYAGASLGVGTVVTVGNSTSFSATGLSGGTAYDFYVYSVNQNCAGGPLYNTVITNGSNEGTQSTTACAGGLAAGTYSVGPTGTYPSLTSALAALKPNGLAGPVVFEFQSTYTSASETFPDTISNFGCLSATNTLLIRPTAGATGLVISGSATSGAGLIEFNAGATASIGTQYVTIDGRPGGTGGFTSGTNLMIKNTGASLSPAIRFINDARYNIITYCDLRSDNVTAPSVANAGVVSFGTANTNNLNGNDNNTISNCDIRSTINTNVTLANCISSIGTTSPPIAQNDGNIITNCNIYDFFNTTTATAGIYVGTANGTWSITNNKIFQSASRSYAATALIHRGIWLTPGAVIASSGFVVTGNTIGYASSGATGVYTMTGTGAYTFYGMDISIGNGTTSTVQNNLITAISMTVVNPNNPVFSGISTVGGNLNITSNIIGASTGNGAITIANNSTSTTASGTHFGIRLNGGTSSVDNVSNNTIGSITITNTTTTSPLTLYGIGNIGGTTNNVTINNNTIGSTSTTNSLFLNEGTGVTVSIAQQLLGIAVTSGVTNVTVSGNTIANLTNAGTGSAITTAGPLYGIDVSSGTTDTVTNNTVSSLTGAGTSTGSGSNCAIVGITVTGSTTSFVSGNTVFGLSDNAASTTVVNQITGLAWANGTGTISKNLIYNIGMTAANSNSILTGLDCGAAGTATFANNMIRMGYDGSGNAITTPMQIRGIQLGATAGSIYFNSVYVGGTGVTTGAALSAAMSITSINAADNIRDNIFSNMRQNSTGTGIHAALRFGLTPTAFTLNYNDYQYASAGNSVFANNNGTAVSIYNASSPIVAGDINSLAIDPLFISPSTATPVLDLQSGSPLYATGTPISGITTDYHGTTRNATNPVLGADEFVPAPCTVASGGTATPSAVTVCSTNTTTTLSVTGASVGLGSSFQWMVGSISGGPYSNVSGGTGANSLNYSTPANLSPGIYYYVFKDSCANCSCTALSNEVTLTVRQVPIVTASSNSPICAGITLNLTGTVVGSPISYSWTGPNSFTSTLQNPSISNTVVAATGTYSFTAYDGSCTSSVTTTNVVINAAPIISVAPTSSSICAGTSVNLTASIPSSGIVGAGTTTNATTGYPTPYGNFYTSSHEQYLVLASELTAAGVTAGNITSLAWSQSAGYTSTAMQNYTVSIAPTSQTALTTTLVCSGFTTCYGPVSYTPPATAGFATITFTTPFVWNGASNIVVDVSHINCNSCPTTCVNYGVNGTVNQTTTSFVSTSYAYNDGDCTIPTCTPTTVNTISQRPNMQFGFPSIGNTFTWAPPSGLNTTTGATVTATAPSTTTYTVTTTGGSSGCSSSATAVINVSLPPVLSIINNTSVSCNGGSNGLLTVSAGSSSPPFTYAWSNGTITNSNSTQNTLGGLTAGTYAVTVTSGICTTVLSGIVVSQPAVLAVTKSITNVSCNGLGNGSVLIGATGGTSPYTGTGTFSNLTPNTYIYAVTDAHGCIASTSVTITQPTTLIAGNSITNNVSCNGGSNGSITVTAGGGTPPYNGTGLFSGLSAGNYVFTVTDANGCTAATSKTLTQPSAITASASATANVSCNGGSNGSASVLASGGTPPYNGTGSFTGLAAGNYTFIVTDSKGCTASASVIITQPSAITVSAASNTPVCLGSNINLSSTASGGTGAMSYLWSGPSSFTSTAANPSIPSAASANSGVYSLTVTDANSCTANTTTTVTVTICATFVNLNLFIEGYYVGSGQMNPAMYQENVAGSNTSQTDTIVVLLHNATSPYAPVEAVQALLSTTGSATASFSASRSGGTYYIAVTHRNAIETWSSLPVTLTPVTNYDFTSAASSAYGGNMIEVDAGIWAFYNGDINQDGNIDLIDFPPLDFGINNGLFGYFASDLNGDGNVDLLDFPVLDANINAGIFAQYP